MQEINNECSVGNLPTDTATLLNRLDKYIITNNKGHNMYYGISTGESGEYGVGDLVVGTNWSKCEVNGNYIVDGESCFNVVRVDGNEIAYVNTGSCDE